MEFLSHILLSGALYAVAAIGLLLQIRSGQLNVGMAVFVGIGGYATGVLSIDYGLSPFVTIPVGIVLGFVAGGLFSALTLRLHHWFFAVTTLSLSIAAQGSVGRVSFLGGPNGLAGIPPLRSPALVIALLVVTIAIVYFLDRSRAGLAIRATGDDEQLSQIFGVRVKRLRIFVFALGSAIGAASGALNAHRYGVYQPSDLGSEMSLMLLVYVIVGGKRMLWGPILGTLVLYVLPEFIEMPPQIRVIIFGSLMIVCAMFMRDGIAGALAALVSRGRQLAGTTQPTVSLPKGDVAPHNQT
jgi:branched-chain amino acid transport system permease protein